jgi:hypothetical protein
MPSVPALDDLMKGWSEDWRAPLGFPNYFEAAWRAVEDYYASANAGIRPAANFEKVLGELVALAHWMTPAPLGNALRQLIAPGVAPPGLAFPAGPYGATVTVYDQVSNLLVRLAQHMRDRCPTILPFPKPV